MTSPIKVGDIVRVTDIDPVEQIDGSHLYECEPLNHGALDDIEAASVMLERAHHRIGELTRERNAAQDLADMRQNARAREAEAKLAERDHERDLRKAAERALAEAQRELPTLPRSPCCNAAVRCGRCGDEFARREPTTHEKMLQPIGASQPNGYDPGARPATEKAADPHAWATKGTWAVVPDACGTGPFLALKLRHREGEPGWWAAVKADGRATSANVAVRRPATPEETERFEAELARNTPKTAPAFKDEAEYIACLSSAGGAGVDDTKGPTTISIPLKVGDSFVVETDGPNLVSVAVERCTCSEAQTICPRCLRILRQSEP